MHAYKNNEGTQITEWRNKSIHLTGEIVYEMNEMTAAVRSSGYYICYGFITFSHSQFPTNHGYYLHQQEKSAFAMSLLLPHK